MTTIVFVLLIEDKLTYLEHLIHDVPIPAHGQELPPDGLIAHTTWVKASIKIVGLMLMTIDPRIQKNLEQLGAHDMLKELKTLFSQQAEHELPQTMREFHACKQDECHFMSSYVLRMKSYIDNLERLGHPMSLNLVTVNELHATLKLHEQTLPKKDVAPALHAIQEGRIQKNNQKNKKSQMATKRNNQGK
ncbi:hypothetical protein Tco_1100561 [Tanacetum coccineum]